EHHDGLLLATRLQQGTRALTRMWSHDLHWQAEYVTRFFDDQLDLHFRCEEEVVFPAASEHVPGQKPVVEKLIGQHRRLQSLVEYFRKPANSALGTNLREFGAILEEHIRIEEREFFPKCEEGIPEDVLSAMESRMKQFMTGPAHATGH
ncbi:MAG TPA: hemerythrin domain-containing protein, partial [Bacteroidota bacterium]|nr:hemerythrin domain-containing protein [Bacteroidota bacterium]